MAAAYRGAAEIGSTVLSISISLVAVFIPILMMGGIIGRLFREFAVTLSVTILVSLIISLTTTPMMSARLLSDKGHGRLYEASEKVFNFTLKIYEHSLGWVLRHAFITLMIAMGTLGAQRLPVRDYSQRLLSAAGHRRINGNIIAQQDTSFQAMVSRLQQLSKIVQADPGVASVAGFSGGGGGTTINTGRFFISLKSIEDRNYVTADQIIARLRPKLAVVPGATLYLQAYQDVRVGGRQSAAQYQYNASGR